MAAGDFLGELAASTCDKGSKWLDSGLCPDGGHCLRYSLQCRFADTCLTLCRGKKAAEVHKLCKIAALSMLAPCSREIVSITTSTIECNASRDNSHCSLPTMCLFPCQGGRAARVHWFCTNCSTGLLTVPALQTSATKSGMLHNTGRHGYHLETLKLSTPAIQGHNSMKNVLDIVTFTSVCSYLHRYSLL